jgi:hypothetical protein
MNARSWAQPLAPALASPDRFMHLRLMRDEAWLNEGGTWQPILGLASVELWSILAYLRWHAPVLGAQDRTSSDHADLDAYLVSRPLVGAIDRELAARGEITSGTALVVLRALGVAPWELPPRRSARRRAASS